jgi:flagellar hook-associated protein 2
MMGISSVGAGSGILTQDVLDQLRAADEAGRITPLELKIANEGDKKDALEVLDAKMTNLADSIKELSRNSLFDERATGVIGTSVSMTADANSDLQDFTLNVQRLATKEIVESGTFTSQDNKIATDDGYVEINVGTADPIRVDYTSSMTLEDFKKAINDKAGEFVTASLINISSGDTRLVLTAKNTGDLSGDNTYSDGVLDSDDPDISIIDKSGFLSDDNGTTAGGTKLTSGIVGLQSGEDSLFEYNGQAVTRSSNQVDDLVTGYKITLEEIGTSTVTVSQNRDNIMDKIDSFIEKYNSAVEELGRLTKSSTDAENRGIFSNESIIKSMEDTITTMLDNIGGGVGSLYDFGFDIDKDGKMTVDKDIINQKIDESSSNFEAFFSGGTYIKDDGSSVELTGAFKEMSTTIESYTKYNATLDQFKDTILDTKSTLEERKLTETEKLDAKYEILKKQFIAYDIMISKLNSASSMFAQMVSTENATNQA